MCVFILVVLLGAAVAVPRNPQRIMGGDPTTIERYPFMVDMHYDYGGGDWSPYCGGALLTRRSVLSAAQCYLGDSPQEWRAHLGSSFHASGGYVHEISSIILHEEFNITATINDIAIIKLATPAVLSDSIGLARIAGINYNLPDGTLLTAVGWGARVSNGLIPGQLHHVDVHQINHELCTERYAYLKTLISYRNWPDVTDTMICDGVLDVGGKGSCTGDAGGPLVHGGDVVVGIMSWGYLCGDHTYPAVNTRVTKYVDWILANSS